MKKALILCILAYPGLLFGQDEGITFEDSLNWQATLQKAKAENKYILVDCYASWCGPCKWMDQHVYVNDTVGNFMSTTFIAVKLQMDTTQHDNTTMREWYSTAHEMGEQYRIRFYPSYLFFSPDGRAIHKAIGAVNVQDFIALCRKAMDPRQQYYSLLTQYQQGIREYGLMAYLANTAKKVHEDSMASVIAADYVHYLGGLPERELWIKDNIEFIGSYGKVIRYEDRVFGRYLHDRIRIDSIMGSVGYTDRLINLVAYNDDVRPRVNAGIKDSLEPNWHFMEKSITKKYGPAFARKNVLQGRLDYYYTRKQWRKYAKYVVLDMKTLDVLDEKPGVGTSMMLNYYAYAVFKYSRRKGELETALSWVDKAILMNHFQAEELDTKANLLYKLGRIDEGVALEEKSHNLAPGNKDIQENYEKMKNGQPTW